MADVLVLFDEYAAAFVRGESPDLRAYLARAGVDADELARLVDGFVARTAAPEPSAERIALAQAWAEGNSPLLDLRTRQGLKRDDVVDLLVGKLRLDTAKREKVKRYYHELESGLLAPGGVDRRVWDVLAEALQTTADALRAWRPRPLHVEPATFLRAAPAQAAMAPMSKAQAEEPDEIDRLFRSGA